MRHLRNQPIKNKLVIITMLASGIALTVACLAFFTYEQLNSRARLVQNLAITAEMTGENSAAGLAFDEAESVDQSLKSLSAQPNILCACIYNKDGQPFAQYQRAGINTPPPSVLAQKTGHVFAADHLDMFHPIELAGDTIGTVYIRFDLSEMRARIWRYLAIVCGVLAASGLIAFFLSTQLQKVISEPLTDLARTVTVVAQDKNYTVRAAKQGEDELGRLIDGFNGMLGQIQERDNALLAARDHLEIAVAERTKELAKSLSLIQATLESTTDGILVADGGGKVTTWNEKFIQMWQIPRDIMDAKDETAMLRTAMSQLTDPRQFAAKVEELYGDLDQESFDLLEFKDGRIFERYSKPQRIGEENAGRVWSFRDVTARKQADAQLAFERDLLNTMLDNLPDAIYFKDLQSRFVRFSKSYPQLYHIPNPEEILGKTDFDFFTEAHARPAFNDEMDIIRTGQPLIGKLEKETHIDGHVTWALTSKVPWRDKAGRIIGTFGTSKDITAFKEAEAKLEEVHRQLVDASRHAGMAEVATSVLHNVGNVLNSVNTSAGVITDLMRSSPGDGIAKVATLLEQHRDDMADFLGQENRAEMVINYLKTLDKHLAAEQATVLTELRDLNANIEHIKEIVAMQQSYAKVSGVVEVQSLPALVEDALRMHAGGLERHQVRVLRQYDQTPDIPVDKHKVLQILVNLISNAKYSLSASSASDRLLTVGVHGNGDSLARISITDSGVGIPPDNLTRIFAHGFTTRKDGHGFGLHSGALAAQEMGGALRVHSEGVNKGAVFTLELPLAGPDHSA